MLMRQLDQHCQFLFLSFGHGAFALPGEMAGVGIADTLYDAVGRALGRLLYISVSGHVLFIAFEQGLPGFVAGDEKFDGAAFACAVAEECFVFFDQGFQYCVACLGIIFKFHHKDGRSGIAIIDFAAMFAYAGSDGQEIEFFDILF